MRYIIFLFIQFLSLHSFAQTPVELKTVADRYDQARLGFNYELHSYDQHSEHIANANADLLALQSMDSSTQQTSLWQNLHFYLKAQISQDVSCKPYYWNKMGLYNLQGAYYLQRWLLSPQAPQTLQEFNQQIDEGVLRVQAQLKYLHERLIKIQVDNVIPPRKALEILYMLDQPGGNLSRLGLTNFVSELPNLTCTICSQIDGQKLLDKYDAEIGPIEAEVVAEFDKVILLAKDNTPLEVPLELQQDCFRSVLTGIYSDLTGPMVLKKGENELLRAEKSMLEILWKLGKPLTPPLSISVFIEQVYNEMALDPKYHLKTEEDYQKIYDVLYQRFLTKKDLITSNPTTHPLNYTYMLGEGYPKSGGYYFNDDEETGYFDTVSGLEPGYLSFEVAWLFIHEGLPGHHLEQSIDYDFRKKADNIFDQNKSFSPYVEGWGLYTEELAVDLDLYQNLEEQFAMFDGLRLRALRMINSYRFYIDGWDEAAVVAFTDEHLFGGTQDAIDAVSRAKRWDAQGVGYMTGKTILLSMKNSALRILGSGCFTLAEYHDSFLTKGSVHLDALVWQTSEWIKNNKCYRGKLTRDEIEDELRKDIISSFAN